MNNTHVMYSQKETERIFYSTQCTHKKSHEVRLWLWMLGTLEVIG